MRPSGGEEPAGEVEGLLGRCTFPPPGTEVVCAVSGGADSLALLVLSVSAGCRVTAVHVDHCLRAGSEKEAALVEAAASRYGARFVAQRVEVAPGPNLEGRAREARRAVLPPGAATGHTMDDQAETVLLNLLRGAGVDGLSAMKPGFGHPLLGVRRAETRALCESAGLRPIEDPMNRDRRFRRTRVRHELIPMCNEIAGRDVVPVLARQAQIMSAEAELLDEMSEQIDPSDAGALASGPLALSRRAVRRWLRSDGYPPDLRAVERVLDVARGKARGTDVVPGLHVRRSRGVLAAAPVQSVPRDDVG